jgi:hypothetical protein
MPSPHLSSGVPLLETAYRVCLSWYSSFSKAITNGFSYLLIPALEASEEIIATLSARAMKSQVGFGSACAPRKLPDILSYVLPFITFFFFVTHWPGYAKRNSTNE